MTQREFYSKYTPKQQELIKKILKYQGKLQDFVVLKEDEQGRYIEYMFIPGAPKKIDA